MLNSREIGTCVGRYDSFFAFEKITNHVVIVFEADLLFIHTFCRQVVFFPIKIQTCISDFNRIEFFLFNLKNVRKIGYSI